MLALLSRTGFVIGRLDGRRPQVVHDHGRVRDHADRDERDDHDQAGVQPKKRLRCHSDPLNAAETGFQRWLAQIDRLAPNARQTAIG